MTSQTINELQAEIDEIVAEAGPYGDQCEDTQRAVAWRRRRIAELTAAPAARHYYTEGLLGSGNGEPKRKTPGRRYPLIRR
jgi:hypothetical protein